MTQELIILFTDQKRYRELYYLLIEDGQLEPALHLALTSNLHESIPNDEIEEAFNLVQAEHFQHGINDNFDPYSRLKEHDPCPNSLLSAAAQWKAAASVLATAQSGDMETKTLACVDDQAIRECLCIHVS